MLNEPMAGESKLDQVFWRIVTPGDFFTIERGPSARPEGGGGQTYIDIPLGNLTADALGDVLGDFLTGSPLPENDWPDINIHARVLGASSDAVYQLQFRPRGTENQRYRLANLNRQSQSSVRHPAWTIDNGFPKAPDDIRSRSDERMPDLSYLKIIVARDVHRIYYAGYVNTGTMLGSWPIGVGFEVLCQRYQELESQRKTVGVIVIPPDVTVFPAVFGSSDTTKDSELADVVAELEKSGEFDPGTIEDARQRTVRAIITRRGQPAFRRTLLAAYEQCCAVTKYDAVEALEAAHIVSYKGTDTNHPANGILLRADLHTLFDLHLFYIDHDTQTIRLSPKLQTTEYAWLEGHAVRFPEEIALRPSRAALKVHEEHCDF